MEHFYAQCKYSIVMLNAILWKKVVLLSLMLFLFLTQSGYSQTTLGGVNLGNLPKYLLVYTDGSVDANWQGATKGFVGDVAVNGIVANERTSGGVPYAGTIYTNDVTLGAWASIVDQNDPNQVVPAQAFGSTGNVALLNGLKTDLNSAFTQINALPATTGYTSRLSTSLDGLNTQNGIAETFVINITSGLTVSSFINITGDATDIFILRWDTDAIFSNGYNGQVKFQSGGGIVPKGGLKATNFIHVAGDINSSGGGSNPPAPYPQGPRVNDGTGALITNASDFSGGGFFTGYWLTTGSPDNPADANHSVPWGNTSSLSNGIFVGGWYSITDKFSMTSGTSGVYVSPPCTTNAGADQSICAPTTTFTLTGFTPSGGTWTAQAGNPATATITNAGVVSGMTANGIYKFIYTVSGCLDTVAIERKAKPNAGVDQIVCAPLTTASLTGFSPAGGTWTAQAGNPAAATVTNAGEVSGLTVNGTYNFIYTLNGCADTVAVIRNAKPNAGIDQSICSPQTTASLTGSPAGGTWVAQAGNPAGATVTNAGVVSGMTVNGTYNFIYTLNGCTDTVAIVRKAKPNAGTDQSLACADPVLGTLQTSTTLTGFSPVGGTWSPLVSNPAAATVTNAGAVSGMTVAGDYNFIYTFDGCTDTVKVTVQPCPPPCYSGLVGAASQFGLLGLNNGTVIINSSTSLIGNVGYSAGVTSTNNQKVDTFIGTVYVSSQVSSFSYTAATFAPSGGIIGFPTPNPSVDALLNQANTDAVNKSAYFASLAVNVNLGTLGDNDNRTVNRVGPTTVVSINSLNYNSDKITLVGQAGQNDVFIINVLGSFDFSQSTVELINVSPSNVIWNFPNANTHILINKAATIFQGTILAPTSLVEYHNPATFNGSIIARDINVHSDFNLSYTTPAPCTCNAGIDQNICAPQTTATLSGFTPAGGIWTAQAGNPAAATVTNAGTVSGMTVNGTYRFIYSVNGCADTVTIIRNAKPNAGTDQIICAPQTTITLSGFSPAGGIWSAQIGNPDTAKVNNAGEVTGMTLNGTYYFIYSVNGCTDTVAVTRSAKPNAGADQVICEPLTTTTLTDFSPAGGIWTAAVGNPAAATVTNAGEVSGLTVNGTYNFIYTLNGCADTVAVTRNAKPNAGADQVICEPLMTTTLTGFSPAGGTWTAAVGNPAAATVTNVGEVSGLTVNGTYNFIYTLNGCADTVAVIRNAKPNAGADQAICEPLTTTNLTGFSPAGGTWTAAVGNPAAATVTNAGEVSGLTVNGTYNFIYTLNGCADTVAVIRNPKPNAGADQAICEPLTTTTLTGFSPAGGTWTAAVGNPAAATVTNAGEVSGLTVNGTYNFIYTLNGCADTVAVTRNAKPNAGADQVICEPLTTTTLTGFSPAGGTWTAAVGNPAAATVTNAGEVSGLTVNGTYNFIYTLNGCADTVAVTRSAKPNAGADQAICEPLTTTTLTGFSPAGGTWTAAVGNPAAATVTNAGEVSGLTVNGTYRFIYSVLEGDQTCTDTVVVIRDPKPVVGDATICEPATTASVAVSPLGGSWIPVGTNPASATITANGVISGLTVNGTYQFIYTLNGCSDTATVIRNPKPNAGPDIIGELAICNTIGSVDLPDAEIGETWTQLGNTPKLVVINPSTGVVTGMDVAGVYQFVLINTTTECSDTVSVEVKVCNNGSIGDFVWNDLNNNGQQDAGEPGVNGVKVILWSSVGGVPTTKLDSTVTSGNGAYSFTGLPAGDYIVQIVTSTLPSGFVISPLLNVGNDATDNDFTVAGLSPVVSLNPVLGGLNQNNPTIDAGIYSPLGSIGDFVWNDLNNNGQQDAGEPGVNGVKVILWSSVGGVPSAKLDSTVTSGNGAYNFTGLPAGDYIVQIVTSTLPSGFAISPLLNVGNDATDNDFTVAGLSPVVSLDPVQGGLLQNNTTIDGALFSPLGSIGDFVWNDLNNNGQQDAGEPGVNGVKVILWSSVGGVPSAKLDSTVTSGNGAYSFTGLPAGDYIVQIVTSTLPSGFAISPLLNVGNDATDNDFTVAGLSPVVSLDPVQGGLLQNNTTIDGALFSPLGSIGDFVWNDLNNNGQQDAGEPGVNGVKVILWSSVGGVPSAKLDSTVTSGNGAYSFTGLPAGDYIVQIVTSTLPSGFAISPLLNVGNDATDNDFTVVGLSPVVSLNPVLGGLNQNNPTIDAGLFSPLGSIGDFVWNDLNNNGQQDAGEPGVNGVKVILWSAVGGVPTTKLDSTVTSGNGAYSFTGLPAGDYIVQIVTSTLPSGFAISPLLNVGNDATDNDFTVVGLSPVVSLNPVLGGLNQNNPTIDAGLFSPLGSIGDFVWNDLNNNGQQDAGEPGVNGVKVILWSAVGGVPTTKLDSTVTSGNGAYSFTGLPAGDYIVQIVTSTLPSGFAISPLLNVGNDATDNDFTVAGLSPVVSLDPVQGGLLQNNTTIDGALFSPCVNPVIGTVTPTAATCTGTTTNNDAKFTVSGISGGDRYSFATSIAGLATYTNATILSGNSINVLNLPNPGPTGQTYYVRIYNGKNDCFTDVTVLIPYRDCGNNCEKPNAGPDVTICKPAASYDLPDATSFQEWISGPDNPVPATVNPSTGLVNGMTVSGVYTFILRDKSLSSTCSDTVSIFLGVQEIPRLSTCFDTLTLPAVSGATYSIAPGNSASVTPSGFASGMNSVGTVYTFIISSGECVDTVRVERLDCEERYDLALDKTISKKMAMLGDTLTYTLRVWNEGEATVHGIEVTDPLNAGVQYISSNAEMGMYSSVSKKWSFDSLMVGDTVSLTIKVRVIAQGVWFNTAEITKMTEEDLDSTPNNGVEGEDDIDRECFTVPILICRGQGSGIQLSVPGQYTGVVWFRKTQNGEPVQVGTGNTFLATETELGNYEYSFTSTSGTCPAEGCCPIVIVVEDCCPADVCVPFVITKKKK